MNVKIEACARELKPLRTAPNGPLFTGIKINGQWYNIAGDHRNLYNKVADLVLTGNIAEFASPQQPPAPAQTPPKPTPPTNGHNGHTPHWPSRDMAVEAYVFYYCRVAEYTHDPIAAVRAANCLVMMEQNGEINPVHADNQGDNSKPPF